MWAAEASRLTCVILSCSGPPQRLHPSEEEVDHYHALYMKALCSCLRSTGQAVVWHLYSPHLHPAWPYATSPTEPRSP